jgi:hypothetical protein
MSSLKSICKKEIILIFFLQIYSMDLDEGSTAGEEDGPSSVWIPSNGIQGRPFQVIYDTY